MTERDKHIAGNFYEFFAGGGMARAGLGTAWTCVFANDIDTKKALSYARNWGKAAFKPADIAKLTTADLTNSADLAWASFPCQDLSLAGSGAGLNGKRSSTFWPFWRLMQYLGRENRAPALIVIENVCGALTSHQGRDFVAIATAITKERYRFGAIVIDAMDFVPQSRPRLFIVAVREDVQIPEAVKCDGPDPKWHTSALVGAYSKLPEAKRDNWVWWSLPHPLKRETVLADLIEQEPTGVSWHTSDQTRYLQSLMSDVNLEKVAAAKAAGRRVVGTIYRRTRPDGNGGRMQRAEIRFDDVAGCLRTPVGGSSRQTIMIVDGARVLSRLLSPREVARLMGLPDHYVLPENYNDAYHLAGDGLVVPVVRHLTAHVLEPLLATVTGLKTGKPTKVTNEEGKIPRARK